MWGLLRLWVYYRHISKQAFCNRFFKIFSFHIPSRKTSQYGGINHFLQPDFEHLPLALLHTSLLSEQAHVPLHWLPKYPSSHGSLHHKLGLKPGGHAEIMQSFVRLNECAPDLLKCPNVFIFIRSQEK